MKALMAILTSVSLVSTVGSAGAVQDAHHTVINQQDIKWAEAPAKFPKGAEIAVLQGVPAQAGLVTLRAKFPANYMIPPHFHPKDEAITVISGSLEVGFGTNFNPAELQTLSVGGFMLVPAGEAHYILTKEETVLQANLMGPFDIVYINPKDDPTYESKAGF